MDKCKKCGSTDLIGPFLICAKCGTKNDGPVNNGPIKAVKSKKKQ